MRQKIHGKRCSTVQKLLVLARFSTTSREVFRLAVRVCCRVHGAEAGHPTRQHLTHVPGVLHRIWHHHGRHGTNYYDRLTPSLHS